MGADDKALADYNEAIRLKPDFGVIYADRARIYGKRKDYDRQIADLKEEIRLLTEQGAFEQPAEHSVFEQAIKLTYISLAQAYDNKGDIDRAIAELDKLLQKKPDYYDAYANRAGFHLRAKEYDAVIADASEMIRLQPNNAFGYSARSKAYVYKKDHVRALADSTQAIRLEPEMGNHYMSRALLFSAGGDYERAAADASQLIKLGLDGLAQPKSSRTAVLRQVYNLWVETGYRMRAQYRFSMGDFENALADSNELIRLQPNNGAGYTARGELYYWQKQFDPAVADLEKALQLDPSLTRARKTKALALLRLGKTAEASAETDAGLRMGKDRDDFLFVRGQIAYAQGSYAHAIDDYTEAMKLAPFAHPFEYLGRGAAYEKLGQKALAVADYKTAIELDALSPAQREARIEARQRLSVLEAEMLTAQQPAHTQAQPAAVDLGRRVALIIGIGAYDNAPQLRNPASDAAAMAAKLRELGFAEVVEVRDPTRAGLEAALMAFGDKAADADWALVFYAGHGMQVEGRNFLIPKDARLDSDRHVGFETVGLDRVLESAGGAKKLSLVILDACRDNPFLKRMRQTRGTRSFGQGLAAVDPVQGQMIVYATKDGSVANDGEGEHSPFTEALLAHIAETHLDIRLMFSKVRDAVMQKTQNKQQPFTYGSLPGEGLFFKLTEK